MTKRSLEVHGNVRARLRVKNSYKIWREVHRSTTAGARPCKTKIKMRSSVRAQLRLRIVTRLGKRCTAVPLQVQGSDKTKF